MKKLIFISFSVFGFSNLVSAQQAETIRSAPANAETIKNAAPGSRAAAVNASKEKTQAEEKRQSEAQQKKTSQNTQNYKKAGLTETQITEISESAKNIDKRKAEIESNKQLSPEEKKNALAAIEKERSTNLIKIMGNDSYKKYNELNKENEQTKAKLSTHPN